MSENKKMEVWQEKTDVRRQFGHILDIIKTYFELPQNLKEYVLDLQLYQEKDDKEPSEQTEPRIWLSCPKNNLGIRLMLYSIKLENKYGKVSNEDAIEVFSEYMKYYAQNQDKFKIKSESGFEWSIKIKFEISNRDSY